MTTQDTHDYQPLTLTDSARASFRAWLADVARPSVRADAVESEALDIIEDRMATGESLTYELGQRYTSNGRPAEYVFAEQDFERKA